MQQQKKTPTKATGAVCSAHQTLVPPWSNATLVPPFNAHELSPSIVEVLELPEAVKPY